MIAEAHETGGPEGTVPSVLFVCVHNAGRSQMAAAFLRTLGGGRINVLSAGSEPADRLNPAVVQAMAEAGIDITAQRPRLLSPDAVLASDAVVTMGCGDACPIFPGKRYEDWALDDPAGRDIEAVRAIRDAIESRVRALIDSLVGPGAADGHSDHSRGGTTVERWQHIRAVLLPPFDSGTTPGKG